MVGKTNLDQFAAGLVGTRTPYGTARNPFDDRFIPGGSSSGSGAAIGGGLLSFALGTDTAGSGTPCCHAGVAQCRCRSRYTDLDPLVMCGHDNSSATQLPNHHSAGH